MFVDWRNLFSALVRLAHFRMPMLLLGLRHVSMNECIQAAASGSSLRYESLLYAILDPSPTLSSGNKSSLEYISSLAITFGSRVTVVVPSTELSKAVGRTLDAAGCTNYSVLEKVRMLQFDQEIKTKLSHFSSSIFVVGPSSIRFCANQSCTLSAIFFLSLPLYAYINVLQPVDQSKIKEAVVLGDLVDEVMSDILVISSEAVHKKGVDMNLLAEFCAVPVLLLP